MVNIFKIVYGVFYQTSEVARVARGIDGVDELGVHTFHGTMEFVHNGGHGRLNDKWGWSSLTDVVLEPEWRFEFTKTYDRRPDTIRYELKWSPSNLFWEGDWVMSESGRVISEGVTRLYLIDSSPSFFKID